MDNLSLNTGTRRLLDTYAHRPAHALLLNGQAGVGLHTIAVALARKIDERSNVHEISPDEKGTITIDTIRALYRLGRTSHEHRVFIVIDDADAMGREAQNALLKMLEEPAGNVHFIMTTHSAQSLLPTILSRVQSIDVMNISQQQSEQLISSDSLSKPQLLFLATGLPAELYRLQTNQAYFDRQSDLMKQARVFLQGDTYEKIMIISHYASSRAAAEEFLRVLLHLMTFMLLNRQDTSLAEPLERIQDVVTRLKQNAHAKTQLLFAVTAFSQSDTIVN